MWTSGQARGVGNKEMRAQGWGLEIAPAVSGRCREGAV